VLGMILAEVRRTLCPILMILELPEMAIAWYFFSTPIPVR
jgi:hypothetical protein